VLGVHDSELRGVQIGKIKMVSTNFIFFLWVHLHPHRLYRSAPGGGGVHVVRRHDLRRAGERRRKPCAPDPPS
jgi:hypothetical protein